MSSSPETFEEDDIEPGARGADRPSALTPLLELAHGDGYRWASLDVIDLDPPTRLGPSPAR
jgi:hypothetical protein